MRTNPLAPDTLATQQFASVFQASREPPEKRLLLAVMMSAFTEFEEAVHSPEQRDDWAFRELVLWFFNEDKKWFFSFENLCEQLDLNPECIRRRLKTQLNRPCRRRTFTGKGTH